MTVPGPYGTGDPGWAQPGQFGPQGYGPPNAYIPPQTAAQPGWGPPTAPGPPIVSSGYDAYSPAGYPMPGYPPAGYPMYAVPVPMPRNGMGTAALVLGIIAVVLCWIPWFVVILGALAIIFGGVGIARANQAQATNKSSAMAGLILGIISIAACFILWGALYATMSAIFA